MTPRAQVEGDGIPLAEPRAEQMDDDRLPPAADPAAETPPEEPDSMDAPLGPEGASDPAARLPKSEGESGTGAIAGKYNSSPVGDIKMSKVKGMYNTYKLEMSMGQLEVIRSALESKHDDVVSDELLSTLSYYMDKLPGPGEEEEEAEARNGAKGGEGEEAPIPAPPGESGAAINPKDIESLPEPEKPGSMPPGKAKLLRGAGKPKLGLPEPEEPKEAATDDRLPAPPAE